MALYTDNGNIFYSYINSNSDNLSFFTTKNYNPHKNLIPTRVIFNDRATVCYFPDGDKIVVKCAPGENFVEEVGVTEAIVRKLFKGNRSEFLRLIENAYRQEPKTEKTS